MTVELYKEWFCPNCYLEHRSQGPETAFHNCPSINGNPFIPLARKGDDCINKVNYREDYVKDDICSVRDDDDNIIMSVSREYADGSNALTVFVPCAVAKATAPDESYTVPLALQTAVVNAIASQKEN
jgi:hypothetical protein